MIENQPLLALVVKGCRIPPLVRREVLIWPVRLGGELVPSLRAVTHSAGGVLPVQSLVKRTRRLLPEITGASELARPHRTALAPAPAVGNARSMRPRLRR